MMDNRLIHIYKQLDETCTIVGYHGTTKELAHRILREGFKPANPRDIVKEAYAFCGVAWEHRRMLPKWMRDNIEREVRTRITVEKYTGMSFGPYGVAKRWAGKGGEVFHETVRQLRMYLYIHKNLAFIRSEADYEAWVTPAFASSRRWYTNAGKPVIIEALIKVSDGQCRRIKRIIRGYLSMVRRGEWTMREVLADWDHTYQDWKTHTKDDVLEIIDVHYVRE